MVESTGKFHEKPASQPSTTAADQAVPRPITEHGPWRPPAATYYPLTKIESQATFAPPGIDPSTNARPGSHGPDKESNEWHSQLSHELPYNHSMVIYTDHEDGGDDRDDDRPKEHAFWILIYLSALSPLLALPIALYTLVISTLLLLLSPLCFCLKQRPICARFRHILSPLIVFQLRLVYSSYHIDDPVHSESNANMGLVVVFILSPLYAMAIAVTTWVAGVFWLYTAILGNPDGKEDRDDGREAVLAVRGWWERWLVQSLEPEDHATLRESGTERGC